MVKKIFAVLFTLVLVCGLTIGTTWAANLRVGMVFDIGGKGDQSFNDSAYRGLQWASKSFYQASFSAFFRQKENNK